MQEAHDELGPLQTARGVGSRVPGGQLQHLVVGGVHEVQHAFRQVAVGGSVFLHHLLLLLLCQVVEPGVPAVGLRCVGLVTPVLAVPEGEIGGVVVVCSSLARASGVSLGLTVATLLLLIFAACTGFWCRHLNCIVYSRGYVLKLQLGEHLLDSAGLPAGDGQHQQNNDRPHLYQLAPASHRR